MKLQIDRQFQSAIHDGNLHKASNRLAHNEFTLHTTGAPIHHSAVGEKLNVH